MTLVRYACHGLGVVQPIDILAADLSRLQPDKPPFKIVGGMDPQLEQFQIEEGMSPHDSFVWIGHSKGAALGYYIPQYHMALHFKLIITVDPMCWASNIKCSEWDIAPPLPGQWHASGNYDRWINIRTSTYPGGGVCITRDHRVEDHHFPDCDHIGVIADQRVRKIIFEAVAKI